MNNEISLKVIEILLISKRARLEKANDFSMNINMYVEGELLKAEIEALEKEKQRLEAICSQAV